jgi:hypothetical protein
MTLYFVQLKYFIVRISRLNWIDHVNRMDTKREESQVYNNKPQGSGIK